MESPRFNSSRYEANSSVGEYLFSGNNLEMVTRAHEIVATIDQLLVRDQEGVVKGILDETYLDDAGVRRMVGGSYVQTENLSHLGFILNTSSKDLIALDEVSLPSGNNLGDVVYEHEEVLALPQSPASTIEEAVARRATVIRAACEILIEEHSIERKEDKSA